MENRVKQFRELYDLDEYKKIKESELFNLFKDKLNITDEDISKFEKKYYPELSKKDTCKKEIINKKDLDYIIKTYEKYTKAIDKCGEFLSNVFDDRLPLLHVDGLFTQTIYFWLGEEKGSILFDYLDKESDMSFDELYEALNA